MTKEYRVLLHLLKKSLRPDTEALSAELLSEVDWQAVMEESAHQAVLISAFDAAAGYKKYIPDSVYQTWFQRASRGLMSNLRVSGGQSALGALLEDKGYPYVILKGETSAAYYPRPDLRHLGDVDFLIDPAQKAKIEDVLVDAGYVREKHESIQHVNFRLAGVSLEMHFRLPGLPQGRHGERVLAYMQDMLAFNAVAIDRKNGFPAPAEAYHGLILLLHMQYHMTTEGLGLRHLCDWAVFVDRTWVQSFWEKQLLLLLQEIGLFKFAAVMTKVCSISLGTVCPDWAQAEETLCDAVLHDILTGGNFGRKDKLRSKASMMIPKDRNGGKSKGQIARLWTTLHESTYTMYPIVQRVRILHPVIDVYRIGVYGYRRLTGRRPSLIKLAPLAQERRTVYEQLEIFETDNDYEE